MTTSGSYFVSKFGWQEGWVDDYDKINFNGTTHVYSLVYLLKSSSDYPVNNLTSQNTKIYHENSLQSEIWRTLFVKYRAKYYNARSNKKILRTRWVTVVPS